MAVRGSRSFPHPEVHGETRNHDRPRGAAHPDPRRGAAAVRVPRRSVDRDAMTRRPGGLRARDRRGRGRCERVWHSDRPRTPRRRERGSGSRRRRAWGGLGGWFHKHLGDVGRPVGVHAACAHVPEPRICEIGGAVVERRLARVRPGERCCGRRRCCVASTPPHVPNPPSRSNGTSSASAPHPQALNRNLTEGDLFSRRIRRPGDRRTIRPC